MVCLSSGIVYSNFMLRSARRARLQARAPARQAPSSRRDSFDEIIGVERIQGELGLDYPFLLVEILWVGEPLRVHSAQHALPLVGALGVVGEDLFHQLFLALE